MLHWSSYKDISTGGRLISSKINRFSYLFFTETWAIQSGIVLQILQNFTLTGSNAYEISRLIITNNSLTYLTNRFILE